MAASEPFEIFTSLRYDTTLSSSSGGRIGQHNCNESHFYMLPYHYERLAEATQQFKLDNVAPQLQSLQNFACYLLEEAKAHKGKHNGTEGPFKVRVSMTEGGDLQTTFSPIPSAPIEVFFPNTFNGERSGLLHELSEDQSWKIFLDIQATPSTAFTSYKTNQRGMYDEARLRSLPKGTTMSSAVEVVMYNTDDEITEGSLTSVFVCRDGRWVTPPLSSGCQRGTTRRWVLEKGLCIEETIKRDSLVNGEKVIVSNGARGFRSGTMIF